MDELLVQLYICLNDWSWAVGKDIPNGSHT